jgi:menaquinone-dependent protoporphyrinogen oxidase
MEPLILVAYATRSGSTVELAHAVAEILSEYGLKQEVCLARKVTSLAQSSAVVLIAPLYFGRLHREATAFLKHHRPDLERRPVALIVPGPVRDEEKEWAGARQQLNREMVRFSWLKPMSLHLVGGIWDPARLGFPLKLVPALRRMPRMDARDWNSIRADARELAARLQSTLSAAS